MINLAVQANQPIVLQKKGKLNVQTLSQMCSRTLKNRAELQLQTETRHNKLMTIY